MTTPLLSTAAESALADREGSALRWTAILRMALLAVAGILILLLEGTTNEAAAAGRERAITAILGSVVLSAQIATLWLLRRRRNFASFGWLGPVGDSLVLCCLPIIWYDAYPTEPLAHLTQHNFTGVCIAIIALNGLALRPLYPALVTGVSVILHSLLGWVAISDPHLQELDGGLQAALGAGTGGVDLVLLTPYFLLVAGSLITLATKASRTLVQEAVTRERSEHLLREQQLEAVLEAKMAAVTDLVAGVEHEVNNPLGALRSATDTAGKAAARVRLGTQTTGEASTESTDRALSALEQSLSLASEAGRRISDVMATIRGFVQLDRAELQRADLGKLIHNVIDIHRSALRDDTRLARDIVEDVFVEVDARRITEALSTVVQNATESFDGPGEIAVHLKAEEGHAVIEVCDTGRGIPQEEIEGLFEIDFAHGERTHARFGLPLCRSILHRHKGEIELVSEVGRGTTATIRLPLAQS